LLASAAQAAFEDLLAVLQDPEAEVRNEAAQALVEIDAARAGPAVPHLIARLPSADATVRGKVIQLLVRIAPVAELAVPALANLLTDPEVRLEAALALVDIDAGQAAPAVPVLRDALQRPTSREAGSVGPSQEVLLEVLGRIGLAAAAAEPTIRQALRSSDLYVRTSAANVLVRVAPELTTEAATTLIGIVEEASGPENLGDPIPAFNALEVLEEISPAAKESVPRLEAILFDEEKRRTMGFPDQLLSTLVKIDGTAAARMRARIEADLQSNDRFDKAVGLLTDLGSAVPATVAPLLKGLLQDPRAESQWDSIRRMLDGLA
jgi:HEAT repeat protein